MRVLLLSCDLLVGSQISGAARRRNVELQIVSDSTQLLATAQAEPVKLVFIDLGTSGFDIALVVEQIHSLKPQPRIVAFGPHVHRAKLSAARAAGCDCVLSRGEFHAKSDAILEEYHSSCEAECPQPDRLDS